MRRPWTDAELDTVRRCYSDTPTKDLARILGRKPGMIYQAADKLGIRKSAAYLASPAACRLRRGDEVGKAHRFKPGQTPPNKGLRRPGWAPGRMGDTQFRRGERSGIAATNWKPIGTILTDSEGFLRIKVREAVHGKEATGFGNTKVWPLLNRYVWEQHHGPIPPSHAVVFKDGNRANCDITNLECISRRDLMLRNTSQRWGKEVFELIQLRGALNRKIRRLSEEQDSGPTQPSI